MPIRTEDVKIQESQRLTDNPDGGGYMTGKEVIDGAINNMFNDISRLDRAYGRVSLRKFYLHVDTEDTEIFSGAHMIITEIAKDAHVNVALFTTSSDSDTRHEAVNRLESYVTLGPRSPFFLWSDQPAGSRQILVFCRPGTENPESGDVFCLFNNKDTASEYTQYVRITRVEDESTSTDANGNGYKVLTLAIGDPLEVTFQGIELSNAALNGPTSVYTTMVSDAAKYYGVMTPTQPIASGDININVESIYTQLVPTSQGETPLTDLTPGIVGPIQRCGETRTQTFANQSWSQINLGQAIVPGTLTLTIGNLTYADQGTGVLMQSSNQVGMIDYNLGRITLTSSHMGAVRASYDPGVAVNQVGATLMIPVYAASRGYNYVAIMWPLPVPGTVMVDYMAEGRWYRLRDNGAGELVPDIEGTGTGRINYSSGQMTITTGALPDVDLPLLVYWGCATEIIQMQGAVEIKMEPIHHTLSNAPVQPGSVTIEWPVGVSETATATDDGNGNITGDATGWVNYGSGEMEFTPTRIPVSGAEYTIHHRKYAAQTWVGSGSGNVLTLPNAPIKPGTLSIDMPLSIGGWTNTYRFRDNGSGHMQADGFSAVISQSRACTDQAGQSSTVKGESHTNANASLSGGSSSSGSYATNESENNTSVIAGGITATIDYTTGQVVFDLTGATSTTSTISCSAGKNGSNNSTINTTGRGYI